MQNVYWSCASVCVCLSVATCPHYCVDPDVTRGMVGLPPSCAVLGRFAIGARVALLWQLSANAKCQWVLVLTLCLVIICSTGKFGQRNCSRILKNVLWSHILKWASGRCY